MKPKKPAQRSAGKLRGPQSLMGKPQATRHQGEKSPMGKPQATRHQTEKSPFGRPTPAKPQTTKSSFVSPNAAKSAATKPLARPATSRPESPKPPIKKSSPAKSWDATPWDEKSASAKPLAKKPSSAKAPESDSPSASSSASAIFGPKTDYAVVLKQLSRRDPRLGRVIRERGEFTLKPSRGVSIYHYLLRSILSQQLNVRAAATIHTRLQAIFGDRDPAPAELLKIDETRLLAAGVSRNKQLALKDLSTAALDGRLPDRARLQMMSDQEIIDALVPIRGVGRWTVEMLLIFALGRADVLALDDFALKKAAMILHELKEMPDRRTFQALGERWRPWRSVASWYLWRSLEPLPGGSPP